MNQLEMMNHYKVNTDDHLHFPAIKKSAHGPNTVSYFFFTQRNLLLVTIIPLGIKLKYY
jgi:hypothetical protein